MNITEHTQSLRTYMDFRRYSPRSVDNYCSNFAGFLAHFEKAGVTHPDRINHTMIKEFLSTFKEPATHSGYHSAIKVYYEHVARVGIDKFKYILRPRKNKKLPIVLSTDEIQKMFNVCTNLKHKVILALLYSAGIRVSELINLKWAHIDRSRMVIYIIQAKGNKDRPVGLNASLIPLLEAYWNKYKPTEYVLNGQNFLQYSARSVGEVIKQLAQAAGITKRVYTHLIRHCTFTHMVEMGTDINLIQRVAGHSNVKTTAIYTHTSDSLISKIQSPMQNIRL